MMTYISSTLVIKKEIDCKLECRSHKISSLITPGSLKSHNSAHNVWQSTDNIYYIVYCGPGSSVGIATELQPGWSGDPIPVGRDFPLSRLALGPTQPPVQWIPDLSRG
jgi:hypothetical protein